MKNKKGITLVSLVVTIIVLIILAGVSINLTLGENGIITMAKKARENMELAKVDEERQLNELYMQIEQEGVSGEISYDAIAKLVEFKRQIASAITDMGIETAENADATTMSSNIRSLTGASSADKVSYDNTNSGLAATNVQGAVDELNDSLGGVQFGIDGEGNRCYLGADGSLIPFKSRGNGFIIDSYRIFDTTASSSYGECYSNNAFGKDGNYPNLWASNASGTNISGEWWKIYFTHEICINSFSFNAPYSNNDIDVIILFQGSNDDTEYDTLDTIEFNGLDTNRIERSLINDKPYLYYRFYFQKVQSNSTTRAMLYNLSLNCN